MIKKYTKAPLPFQGQKRNFNKELAVTLEKFPDDGVYLDMFGGSGMLSHTIKYHKPNATVVWNDFDNYQERMDNIPDTNALLARLQPLQEGTAKNKAVEDTEPMKAVMREWQGYRDYLTISSNLFFSGSYASSWEDLFHPKKYYARKVDTQYTSDGYLEGVERVRMDYRKLYEAYKGTPKLVIVADPPYMNTHATAYTKDCYWTVTEQMELLDMLRDGNPYLYFTSGKSEAFAMAEYQATHYGFPNPFEGAEVVERKSYMHGAFGGKASYQEFMVYRTTSFASTADN